MSTRTGLGNGISCASTPEGVLVTMWGEIDASLRVDAGEAMAELINEPGVIEIDTADVAFLDSTGLAFILQLYRLGREEGRDVVLRDPARPVEDLLAMIGMADRIPVERTGGGSRLYA